MSGLFTFIPLQQTEVWTLSFPKCHSVLYVVAKCAVSQLLCFNTKMTEGGSVLLLLINIGTLIVLRWHFLSACLSSLSTATVWRWMSGLQVSSPTSSCVAFLHLEGTHFIHVKLHLPRKNMCDSFQLCNNTYMVECFLTNCLNKPSSSSSNKAGGVWPKLLWSTFNQQHFVYYFSEHVIKDEVI